MTYGSQSRYSPSRTQWSHNQHDQNDLPPKERLGHLQPTHGPGRYYRTDGHLPAHLGNLVAFARAANGRCAAERRISLLPSERMGHPAKQQIERGAARPGMIAQMYSANSSRDGPGIVTAETNSPFRRTTSAPAATAACTSGTEPAIIM